MRPSIGFRFILLLSLFAAPVPAEAAALPQQTGPRTAETADGLVLEWTAPQLALTKEANGLVRAEIAEYARDARPGRPELPQASALVALPTGADPVLSILEEQSEPAALEGMLQTAPFPAPMRQFDTGEARGGEMQQGGPADGSLETIPVVRFESIGIMRGVRLGRVVFTPLHLAARGWQMTHSIRVRVSFPGHRLPAQPAAQPDPIIEQIRQQVVNPGDVIPAEPAKQVKTESSSSAAAPAAIIAIKDAGLTQITYQALKTAGFPVDQSNPQMLQLWAGDAQIAMEWEGNSDAVFSAGERVIFYANPRFSRYTDTDRLLLKAGAQPGKRISSRSGAPKGAAAGAAWRDLTVEENIFYTPDFGIYPPGYDGDRWTGRRISRPGSSTWTVSFSLPSVDPTLPASLTTWLIGETDAADSIDHRVALSINNTPVGTVEWDGKQLFSSVVAIPPDLLKDGQNSLTLTLPGISGVDLEGMWLDAFRIHYPQGSASLGTSAVFNGSDPAGEPAAHDVTISLDQVQGLRLYDVSVPEAPVRLENISVSGSQVRFADDPTDSGTGRRYAVSVESGLRQPAQIRLVKPLQTAQVRGADYLVITYPDFAPALAPLLQLRSAQGLATAVEDVQAIYDQYGGLPTPEAIRAFLADAYQHWSPRPLYVLLVGDGTNDPKRYHTSSSETWIPPMLAEVDPWMGETAADNLFVSVDGADHLPDMSIGRLPVNRPAEAQTVVAKLVRYETGADSGLWPQRLALAADDVDPAAGNFALLSDHLAALSPAPDQVVRAYYNPPANTSGDIQQSILQMFNSGAGVIVYNGHASIHQWGAENFFHMNDIPRLTNAGKLPLLLEMDCLTASFQVAGYATLDESLLRYAGGGVAAAWGATGWGVGAGHEILAKSLLQDLYSKGQARIGLAALQAKLALAAAQPAYDDLLDTYTLLGDPASLINVTGRTAQGIYLPIITH